MMTLCKITFAWKSLQLTKLTWVLNVRIRNYLTGQWKYIEISGRKNKKTAKNYLKGQCHSGKSTASVFFIPASGKFATGIQRKDTNITHDKFTTDVVDAGGKLPPVLLILGGAPWLVNISANFRKNLKWP
jgi:hypothetical protein